MNLYVTEDPKNYKDLKGKKDLVVTRHINGELRLEKARRGRPVPFQEVDVPFFFVKDEKEANLKILEFVLDWIKDNIAYFGQFIQKPNLVYKTIGELVKTKEKEKIKIPILSSSCCWDTKADIITKCYAECPIYSPELKLVIIPNMVYLFTKIDQNEDFYPDISRIF